MRGICDSARYLLFGVVTGAILGSGVAAAQEASRTYTDSRGRAVVFPLGDASFADEVVSFAAGTPAPRDPRFVRITDLKRACGGPYPGADVDAIGAIGSALRLSFDASVLFDFDRSVLRPEAQAALAEAAVTIAAYADAVVTVEGHTDDVGAAAYNAKLSQARAASVRAFLLSA